MKSAVRAEYNFFAVTPLDEGERKLGVFICYE